MTIVLKKSWSELMQENNLNKYNWYLNNSFLVVINDLQRDLAYKAAILLLIL